MSKGRTKTPRRAVEAAGSAGALLCPSNTPKPVARAFYTLVAQLQGLAPVDTSALLLLAENLVIVRQANKALAAEGYTVSNKSGYYPNPWLKIRNAAEKNALALMKQLGATPHARKETNSKAKPEIDALDNFLKVAG